MRIGDRNLGPPLSPQDLYIWIKLLLELKDDEVLAAFVATDSGRWSRAWPELHARRMILG